MSEQFAVGVDFKDVVSTIHDGPCFISGINRSNRTVALAELASKINHLGLPNLQSFRLCRNLTGAGETFSSERRDGEFRLNWPDRAVLQWPFLSKITRLVRSIQFQWFLTSGRTAHLLLHACRQKAQVSPGHLIDKQFSCQGHIKQMKRFWRISKCNRGRLLRPTFSCWIRESRSWRTYYP